MLLLSDYAGHAFTLDAAAGLAALGHRVCYSYCASTNTPKGDFEESPIEVIAVSIGDEFVKYRLVGRIRSELAYGWRLGWLVRQTRPEHHVVANMPVISLLVVVALSVGIRTRLAIWYQDVQSGIARGVLGDSTAVRVLSAVESFVLRRADAVVAISADLAHDAVERGVRPGCVTIVENWAPVEQIPLRSRENTWSAIHLPPAELRFLYSGTLARKHNPERLVELADAVAPLGGAVVVVSEGEGADWLRQRASATGTLRNLTVLPYQPFDDLPDVLASADVLVVLLEPLAAAFSVPSKTLSYLCAGRPILGSIPAANPASSLITARASAGLVAEPDDPDGFIAAATTLALDPQLRRQLGRLGRAHAEAHFARPEVVARLASAIGLDGGRLIGPARVLRPEER